MGGTSIEIFLPGAGPIDSRPAGAFSQSSDKEARASLSIQSLQNATKGIINHLTHLILPG